ncbi:MAG TPA: hypothetical protein VM368_05805 [Flavisolibacter sp.]|nr:hypothetical protein [Flavisolibacter sp.]
MQKNRHLIFFYFLLFTITAYTQEEGFTSQPTKRGEYSLVAYISGGAGYYISNRGVPHQFRSNISNRGRIGTVRVMWHPDHLLKVGLETGYLTFYTYSFEDSVRNSGNVRLSATPLLVEWTMAVTKRINLFAGSGVYFLKTHLDYAGKTSSTQVSVGWMAAASYIHPLSKDIGLGAEIKWMDAAETADGFISAQVQLIWKFIKW